MIYRLILTLIFISANTFLIESVALAAPYGVGVYNSNIPYGDQTQLTISTNGNTTIPITPSDNGTLGSASSTVNVVSTDLTGYKLYVRSLTSTNMVNGASVLAASANSSPSALAVNTWGYNLDASNAFIGMTTADVLIKSVTIPYPTSVGGDNTTITYGVNIDHTLPAGIYSNTVIYTAVPQTN